MLVGALEARAVRPVGGEDEIPFDARVIATVKLGVDERVLFLDGGPTLTSLLDGACSAVTVNSTAAQQALWRGLPVAALGRAVYARPGLVSSQALDIFFADPRRPDQQAYWQFRQFLAETSQIVGSFYSRPGIAALLEALPAAMLAPVDPYDRVLAAGPYARTGCRPGRTARGLPPPCSRRNAGGSAAAPGRRLMPPGTLPRGTLSPATPSLERGVPRWSRLSVFPASGSPPG